MRWLLRASVLCFCAIVFSSVPEGEWTELRNLPNANTAAGIAVIGEEVFVYGTNPPSAAVHKYSINQDVWTAVTSLPSDRFSVASASVGGDLFSLGGRSGTTTIASSLKYTVSADTWVATTTMPTARHNSAVASSGFKVYVVAGSVLPTHTTVSEQYDVPTDTWQSFASFPLPLVSCSAGADAVAMYVAGGMSGGTTTTANSLYQYHFSNSQWTQKTAMPTSRSQAGGAMIGQKLWVCGGYTPTVISTVEVYNSQTDSWLTANALPAPIFIISARAASYDVVGQTYLFMAGGTNGSPLSVFRRLQGPYVTVASFQGDPLITTFSGQAGHVDLFPAVFNLFSSPVVLANALVVDLPGLPANEDMVMIGIAVRAVTQNNDTHSLYCNTTACESTFALTSADGVVSFSFDALSFQVEFERLHVVDPLGVVAPSDSSFLNLHIRVAASLPPPVGGLLADADRLGFDVVRSRLMDGYYDTNVFLDGCLPSVVDGPLRRLQC